MSFALQATYPGVCFSKNALSLKTKFEITSSSVYIRDPTDGYSYTFHGGSAKYSITITDSGTKKKPYKNITIKRLMPICPISGQPVIEPEMGPRIGWSVYEKSPERGIKFRQGYAFNCYQVYFNMHSKYELNPTLYYKIGEDRKTTCDVYLVVPIVDGRQMQPVLIDALYARLGNMDVIKIIARYYNQLAAKDLNFNFHMADTPIKPDTLYHKRALIDLFLQGHLKLGITNDNFIGYYNYTGSILILEPSAYNHVSHYGKISVLKHMFQTCQEMMDFRELLVSKYLV